MDETEEEHAQVDVAVLEVGMQRRAEEEGGCDEGHDAALQMT